MGMGVRCLYEASMLLTILLLNHALSSLTYAGPADAKSSPILGSACLEDLVEKLELRLINMETKFQEMEKRMNLKEKQAEENKELTAKNKEIETRLRELNRTKEEKDEMEKGQTGLEASTSNLKMEVEESLRKEVVSNYSTNTALTNPCLRDLPIVIISAFRDSSIKSPQTVTFESFLANFNNGNRPGGGSGELDLDSGVFTCFTPGYYTVSFSVGGLVGPIWGAKTYLYLYKNGTQLPESFCYVWMGNGVLNADVGVTQSRSLILHMDAGDTLELRMTEGKFIQKITFNIELSGLGFD